MNTRPLSFAIQGMTCARCAVQIERALTQLDGVIAAQVNYASERATVRFDPTRVRLAAMVGAVRRAGFDAPLEVVTLDVSDLMYAAHPRLVESALSRVEGVVNVAADLGAGQVTVVTIPEAASRQSVQDALHGLGFQVGARRSSHAMYGFVARMAALGAVVIGLLGGALVQLGVGDKDDRALVALSVSAGLLTFVVGYPFYQRALAALVQGVLDESVGVGMLASVLLVIALSLAGTLNHQSFWTWSVWGGFTVAGLLTAGWFVTRGWSLWARPHWRRGFTPTGQAVRHSPELKWR